jgi:hypothetical protein
MGKPEIKGTLVRHRCRWEDNIEMYLQEVVCGIIDWIQVTQDKDIWRSLMFEPMNLHVT